MADEDGDQGIQRKRKLNLLDFIKDDGQVLHEPEETPSKKFEPMSSHQIENEPNFTNPHGTLGEKYSDEEDEDMGDLFKGRPRLGKAHEFKPMFFSAPAMSFQKASSTPSTTEQDTNRIPEPILQGASETSTATASTTDKDHEHKEERPAVLSYSEVETLNNRSTSTTTGQHDVGFKGRKYGIGAAMLKKMGYVEGQGLGKNGQGILEPIEQDMRKAGVGIGGGVVTKKARRSGTSDNQNNEESTSSSDEEEYYQNVSKEINNKKSIYDLISEIELNGLKIPEPIKKYSDEHLQQSQDYRLDAAHNMEGDGKVEQVRSELEHINIKFNQTLANLKLSEYELNEILQLQADTDSMLEAYEELSSVIDSLNELFIDSSLDISAKSAKLRDEIEKIESVNSENTNLDIQKTITIAIKPIVTDLIEEWDPFDFTDNVALEELILLKNVLPDDENDVDDEELDYFQSLLYSLWYPKLSDALQNWSVDQPNVAITILLDWNEVLDKTIIDYATNNIIKPKIIEAIKQWDPTCTQENAPFVWIFEYLPFLEHSMDEIKQQFIETYTPILETWPQSDTHIEGLRSFKEIIGYELFESILNKKLVPNLTKYLFHFPKNFIYPDVSIIQSFFLWENIISEHIFETLLRDAFFNTWKKSLYYELRSDKSNNFENVSNGFEKWAETFKLHSEQSQVIITEVYQALSMINKYIDTGELKPIHTSDLTVEKILKKAFEPRKKNGENAKESIEKMVQGIPTSDLQVTFKDVVEHYCTGNNLLITPLKNDLSTGHSLFKIVGNNLGKNGLTAYINEDVLWIKNPTGKFEPVSLGNLLTRF